MQMTLERSTKTNIITDREIDQYRISVITEMKKLGATDQEYKLIKDATIRNALRRRRKPEDVAWALLQ